MKNFVYDRGLAQYLFNKKKKEYEAQGLTGQGINSVNSDEIATMQSNGIRYLAATDMTKIVENSRRTAEGFHSKVDFSEEYTAAFKVLGMESVFNLTQKTSTPNALMATTVNLTLAYDAAREKMTAQEVLNSIDNFKRHMNGEINAIGLDIESISGNDAKGIARFDNITEFAASTFVPKVGEDGKLGYVAADPVTHLVGQSETKIAEYRKRLASGGIPTEANSIDTIMMTHFARLGHLDSQVNYDAQAGRYTGSLVEQDAAGLMTVENIERGMNRSAKMWETQQAWASRNGGVTAWEKDMVDTLVNIETATKTDKAVLFGHNLRGFDIPNLQSFIKRKMAENPAFKTYAASKGYVNFNPNNNMLYDNLMASRLADRGGNFARLLYGDREIPADGNGKKFKIYSQEALSIIQGVASDDSAHQALADLEMSHKIATSSVNLGNGKQDSFVNVAKSFIKSEPSTSVEIGQDGQLLHMTRGINRWSLNKGLFGFNIDPLDGKIHTHDGYEIANNGIAKQSWTPSTSLAKKGANYTANIFSLGSNKEMQKAFAAMHPDMDNSELYILRLTPDSFESAANRGLLKTENMPSFIVGTREALAEQLNGSMVAVADKGRKSGWRPLEGGLALTNDIGKNGLETQLDEQLRNLRAEGAEVQANDTAAWMIRKQSPSQYRAMGEVNKYIHEQTEINLAAMRADRIANGIVDSREEDLIRDARNLTMMQLKNATMNIAGKVSKNETLTMSAQTNTIKAINTLAGGKKGLLNRGTYDNIIASADYFDSIAPHMNELFKVIDSKISGIENEYERAAYEKFLFQEGMTKLQVAATQQLEHDPDKKAAVIRAYEQNRFEVDITSLLKDRRWNTVIRNTNSPRGNILGLDLSRNGSYNLVKTLGQINEINPKTYNQNAEIKKQLVSLATAISESGIKDDGIAGIVKAQSHAGDNDVIARTIISSLRTIKSQNPAAGILGSKTIDQVIGASEMAAVNLDDYKKMLQEFNGSIYDSSHLSSMSTEKGAAKEARRFAENFMTYGTHNSKEWAKYGFNERQMAHMDRIQRTTLEDSKKFAETLFSGLQKSGYGITYDAKLGMAQIFDKDRGRYYDISNLVPKFRFRDGTFYTEMGRNNVAANLELVMGGSNVLGDAKLMSHIGVATKNGYNLDGMIRKSLDDGDDPIEKIFAFLRGTSSEIRGHSGIDFDPQDKKRQFELGLGSFVDALPRMLKTEAFDGLSSADRKRLIEIADKRKDYWSHEKLSDEAKHLIAKNYPVFAQALGNVPNGDVKATAEWLGAGSKASSMERQSLNADPVEYGLTGFDDMKRDISNLHIREIDADKAKKALKKHGADMAHVKIGNPLMTTLGVGMTESGVEGMGTSTATELIVDRTYISPATLKDKISEKVKELSAGADADTREMLARAGEKLKVGGQVIEGGAVADVRLITDVMDQFDYQKVSFEKQLSIDIQKNHKVLQELNALKDVVPKFEYNEATGGIVFTYSKGRYLNSAEEALKLAGFGNSVEHVIAKNPGVLKLGFFAKGRNLLATAEDVVSAVTKRAGRKVINQDEFMQLASQIYDTSFYIQNAKKNVLRKTVENLTEKHETFFAAFGLGGSGNKRIINTLKELGFGKLVENQTILSEELFSEFGSTTGLVNGHTVKMAGVKGLTEAKVHEAVVGKGKYKSMEDFKQALWEEYIAPSKLLHQVTGSDYAVASNPTKHLSRSDAIRSGYLGSIEVKARQLMAEDNTLSYAAAYKRAEKSIAHEAEAVFLYGLSGESAISYDEKKGRTVLKEMLARNGAGIDFKAADKMFSKYNPDWKDMYKDGHVSKTTIGIAKEWEGRTNRSRFYDPENINWNDPAEVALYNEELISKGTGVSDRELNMLDLKTYDQKYVDEMQAAVDNNTFKALMGDKIDFVDGKAVLRQEYQGKSVLKPLTDSYRSQLFYQEGETELTKDYINRHKEDASYLRKFVDENYMKAAGYDHISVRKAKQLYSAQMGTAAVIYNQHDMTIDQLQKAGNGSWKSIGIGSLDRSTGGDYEYLVNSENSLLRQNVLLDLKNDDVISEELIRKMGNKTNNGTIALGRPLDQRVGDEAILRDYASSVNKMIIARNEIALAGEDAGKKQTAEERFIKAVGEVHERQNATVFGKNGLIGGAAKVELANSFSGKASIMALTLDAAGKVANKSNEAQALQKIMIDGKSLLKHADEGKMFDVKLVSREALEKQGMFEENYMRSVLDDNVLKNQVDTLGSAEEKLAKMKGLAAEKYKTEGFTTMTHRYPTIYRGSMRSVQTYLSDDVESHQVISMYQGAILSKTDSDGDLEYIAKVLGYTKGKSFDSLQMKKLASAEQVQSGAAIRAAQTEWFHAASHENKIARKLIEKDLQLAADVQETVLANSLSDYIYPSSSSFIKPKELASYQESFQKWHGEALDLATGKEQYAGKSREVIEAQLKGDKKAHTELLKEAMVNASENDRHAVASVLNSIEEQAVAIGKGRRSSAGEISLAVFQLRKMREMGKSAPGFNPSQYQQDAFESMMEAAEEGFLSPKHSEAEIVENAGVIEQFNSVRKNMQRGVAGAEQDMIDLFEQNFAGRMRDINVQRVENESNHVFEGKDFTEKVSQQIRAGVSMMGSMMRNLDNMNTFNASSIVGATRFGLGSRAALKALMVPEEAEGQMMFAISRAVSRGIDVDFGKMRASSSGFSSSDMDEAFQAAEEQMVERPSIAGESIVGALKHGIGNISLGKGLARSAVGLAAGLMVAGFVGGNPAKPADRQAEDEQSNEDVYALPELTGTNQLVAQGGPQTGYIININARTDGGRQHAMRAIKQAMSSQSKSKVNIAMNIRDDSGNISDSNIERMIEGALN